MSAEHRLTAGMAGIYGKHPGFGDFISAGFGAGWSGLVDWLQEALGQWRASRGPDWQAAFDGAPAIGFWIGPLLSGAAGLPLRGAMVASQDRSARRFPLIVAQAGGLAPVIAPDDAFDAAARSALVGLQAQAIFEPREAAGALDLPAPHGAVPHWPGFWASNPGLGPQALLGDLAGADHAHATAGRSYWWFSAASAAGASGDGPGSGSSGGSGGSGALCCQGWPSPAELCWLIGAGQDGAGQDGAETGAAAHAGQHDRIGAR